MLTKTIDYKDFLAGESNWDYISNAGFSPDSYGLNLFLKPGVLNWGWSSVTTYTPTGNIIASAYDKNVSSPNDAYQLDDEGAFYTLKGSTYTKRQTVTADTFTLGTADLIQFKLNTYATSNTRITQLTGSDLATVDSSWWTGLTTGFRHPMEVVEDTLYIGDVNVIYFYDGSTTGTAVTLPSDCNITSLRKHPDGRHLIAFTGYTQDYSHTTGGQGKIYIINKDTKVWEREIQIDTQVEGSRLVGGVVYVTYGTQVGYFTGSGIKFLKQLKTSATTYSHNLANMEDFLMVRDGANALAFGDLGNGKNSWHNFYQASQPITNMIYKGNGVMLVTDGTGGGANGNVNEITYTTSTITGRLVSNRMNFGSVVKIRRIDFIHDQKPTASIFNYSLSIRDTDDNTNLISLTYPAGPTPSKTRVELDITTDIFQFILQPLNGNYAFKLIRIYYEPVTS